MDKDELQLNPDVSGTDFSFSKKSDLQPIGLSSKGTGIEDPNNEYQIMETLALDAPLQFMAKYNSPREWILDQREASKARVAFAPGDLSTRTSVAEKVAFGVGNVAYDIAQVPARTAQFVGDVGISIEKTFFPNMSDSALSRGYNALNDFNQRNDTERQQLVSAATGDSTITSWSQTLADAASWLLPVTRAAKVASAGVKAAAVARGIPVSRALGAAGKAAEKAAGRTVVGTSLARGVGATSVESARQYMESTGAVTLNDYDPRLDLGVNIVTNLINANIEKSLGFDAIIPHLYGSKYALLKGVAENIAKGVVGEASEEWFQEGVTEIGEMVRGYRKWWDFDLDRMAHNAVVGGVVGGAFGGGLYYLNRRAMIRNLEKQGLTGEDATEFVDSVLTDGIEKTMNNLSSQLELKNQKGQAWDKLVKGAQTAMESVGFGDEQTRNAQAKTWAQTNTNIAIRQALESGLNIDEFLDIAEFQSVNNGNNLNMLFLKPLGTIADIDARIKEKDAIINHEKELKKTGAGDNTILANTRRQKAILEKAKFIKTLETEQYKDQIKAQTTPELAKEIETAGNDVETVKGATQAEFDAKADTQNLTSAEKSKRYGNAVLKSILPTKTAFDAVMVDPVYANAKQAIIAVADRINSFIKAHRNSGLKTDVANALKKMQTVNQDNFIDSVTTPALDGQDVIAENAFLYHFLFSDATTIQTYLDSYITRAEESLNSKNKLSKKDLVGQSFKATDNAMQTQAQVIGAEYTSIYNEDGSYADKNVMAVMLSYQNQFVQEQGQQIPPQMLEQFDLADENARLDNIYPPYNEDTIVVDGKERTVYNSEKDENGNYKRIAKSKEALTNFWRWFGDSKVVDEQGRPLVVYHGTMSEFDTFDINKAKEGVFGKGFYFAFDETLPSKIGRIVMPVYLKVENPINAEEKVETTWGGYKPKRSIVEIRKEVKKSKYDGVIAAGEIMVKNNTQIKSVDNRGTYSADTGNIYMQGRKANGFYDPELGVIVLGRNMNEMTLPHEMQHYWLDKIFSIYKRAKSGELQVRDEWMTETKALFDMLGIGENQTQLTQGQQEKFARMSEAYLTGIGVGDMNATFKEYQQWIPEKYKSMMNLAYKDDEGKIVMPYLDQAAVDFFNKWYANYSLPSLATSPERQEFVNPEYANGEVQTVSIKEMNNRNKEFGVDAEEQVHTDERLYNTLDENMPAEIKVEADGQRVVQASRSNFLKESEKQQRRWFERKSRDTEAQLAQDYIEKNPEHAKEVIYGDPELIPNDTGIDRATLINAYMALNNITPESEDWATLHTNIAINQSLAGTQLALSNNTSYRTYLDALREIENAREMKAATNYAGAKQGALERFNRDIQRFVDEELPKVLATAPNSEERSIALKSLFERARTKFSGNTTGSVLNQMDIDYAKAQKKGSAAFTRWAINQIKKDAGAKLNGQEQAKLLEISAKAQQATIDLDNRNVGIAVAGAQEIRKWQVEKDKLAGINPQKFSLFGDYAPRAMLASFNTLVVSNIPSTAMNTAVVRMLERGVFGENKVSADLTDSEIKRIKAVYGATAMNLAQMEKPTSPSLLHGEKYSSSGQKWYDPFTILGKEDNWFRVPTFVNTLARLATQDAKATGRNADEVFKEYCRLENQSDEAKLARKQALAVANMAVFTQDGSLARALNGIRDWINKGSRALIGLEPEGFGLGNLLSPFLKTGANIAEMGIRGSIAPITTISALVQSWRTGKAIDPMKKLALAMDWSYFTLSSVAVALLAALTSDDDDFYSEPYQMGRQYDPNKPYDSINIAGVWIDLDFFGPFAIPMRTACRLIQQWKTDNLSAIYKAYGQGAKYAAMDTPLLETIFNNQMGYATKKPEDWATGWAYNQANKLIPAQIKPLSRAISRSAGWQLDTGYKIIDRKFHRNYGFDAAELTTQDLIDIFSTKFTYQP